MLSRRQVFATLAAMLPGEVPSADNEDKPDVEDLVKLLADAVKHLQLTSPPIGSVQAFAGDWPPRKADGTVWKELDIGWLLCDGRKLDDVQAELHKDLEKRAEQDKELQERIKETLKRGILSELRSVIPLKDGRLAEALPDYRGYFLRGMDRGINGVTEGRDKGEKREVSDAQGFTTAMPNKEFSAQENGEHVHPLSNLYNAGTEEHRAGAEVTVHNQHWGDPGKGMKAAGKHGHVIVGGDAETRPINVAVYYIIKFQ